MYQRFTDRARLTMQKANIEAQILNHEYIGTEHVLLGLLQADGVGLAILKVLKIDLAALDQEVRRLACAGSKQVPEGKRPHAPRAKKVIEHAVEESAALNHNYIGTEHLLLGLIREEEGLAAQVLKTFGLTLAKARATLQQLHDQSEAERKEHATALLDSIVRSWHRRLGRNAICAQFSEKPDADEQVVLTALRTWLALSDNRTIESITVVMGEAPEKEAEPPPS